MTMTTKRMLLSIGAATLAAAPLIAVPAQAKSKGSITKMEDALSAAGFEPRPANTPARTEMLARLPADKFTQRVKGDTVAYVYADPKVCNCLYVGDQAAYANYQKVAQAQKIAQEQQDAAQDYQDARWDWGAWGPWGPRWGRFGFGGGFGW